MATNGKPRLAIIGCGAVVDYHHIPSLRRVGWMPSVLVDTSQARLDLVAGNMGGSGKNALKSVDWTKVADKFDAAIVAAPHAYHGPLGEALSNAGKHVFMEKPLAVSTSDCEAVIAAADRSQVALRVGLMRRHLHAARWTKALLAAGVLGEIKRFDLREGFVFNWAMSSTASIDKRGAGGGVLMDTGAHALDLVLWLLGDIDLGSIVYSDDSEGGVEADCVLECKTRAGAQGRVELSRTRDLRNSLRIEGTKGWVEVHTADNQVFGGSEAALAFVHEGMGPGRFPQQRTPDLFDAQFRDFLTAASGQPTQGTSGRDAARSVAVIERCYESRAELHVPWDDVAAPAGAAAPAAVPPGSTVVITGASGFIGGRLAERLVRECGARVRCLVRDLGHATRLARLPVEIVKADLADAAAIDKAVAGAEYVFHCAYDPRSRAQNMTGTQNLIDACLKHDVERLVYFSTISVYEPLSDGPLSEDSRDGDRKWPYTKTKLDLEQLVLAATREKGLRATVLQPTIVYGPFSKPWTNLPAENLLWGEVILPDNGLGLCNAVYIDDLIDGVLLAATRKEAVGERFLLSGPETVTWAKFFGEFAQALGTAQPTYWPKEKIAKSNSGLMHDLKMVASNPKMIVQIIVRWNPARRALQGGLDALPKPLHDFVSKHYFGAGGRKVGQVFIPSPQTLALYAAKASVDNAKATRLLGYVPRYDFAAGMLRTRQYLDWAYGDMRQKARAERTADVAAKLGAPAGLANAD